MIFYIMIALWAIIFVVTLIIELETADLTTIWFCVSSFITLICAIFGLHEIYQLIVFVVLSALLILATRPLTKKMMTKDIIHTNSDRLIGMITTVTKRISNEEIGEVKIENTPWRAVCLDGIDIEVGEKVIINSISGNKVVVSKVTNTNDVEFM